MPARPNAAYAPWQFVGPTNFHQSTNFNGVNDAQSGRVNAIAFDPVNNGTFYIGSALGGVWRTNDSGNTWTPLSDGADWDYIAVSSVAVDPQTPSTIYAGTGDYPNADITGGYPIGIMKSTNSGQSWKNVGFKNTGKMISKVLIDPDNPGHVFAATAWGNVYMATDGGESKTWNPVAVDSNWSDLAYSPIISGTQRYFYAVGYGQGGLFYRSEDGGYTWHSHKLPLTSQDSKGNAVYQQNLAVAASPIFPQRVYLLAKTDHKILVSDTGGVDINGVDDTKSWRDITGNSANDDFFWDQPHYNNTIAVMNSHGAVVDSSAQDIVFAGGPDVQESIGGNGYWISIPRGHDDQHAMAINPFNPLMLMLGNDGGVYALNYQGIQPGLRPPTVTSLNQGLGGNAEIYSAAYTASATQSNWIIAGMQDLANGFTDGSGSWVQALGSGGDGGPAIMDPNNANHMYAAANIFDNSPKTPRYIVYTTDGWKTSATANARLNLDPADPTAPMAFDPNDSSQVFVATDHLYVWSERTQLWSQRWFPQVGFVPWGLGNNQQLSAGGAVTRMVFAPSDPQRIYTGSSDGQLWMSPDHGTTWRENDGSSFGTRNITDISVDPANEDNLIVSLAGQVGGSFVWQGTVVQGTIAWKDVSAQGTTSALPPIAINSIVRDPANPSLYWYAGTDIGVFYTQSGGIEWYNMTSTAGLPNVKVSRLTVDPNGFLYAATFGRGIWRATLGCVPRTSCVAAGANCGMIDSGCGFQENCGSCQAPSVCGGDGTPNVCSCVPKTCQQVGYACGTPDDGCGHPLNCGTCQKGYGCSGGVCKQGCVPMKCMHGWAWNDVDCQCECNNIRCMN